MNSTHVLIHDLFLLIIHLAQLKDPQRVIQSFVDSINAHDLGISVFWSSRKPESEEFVEEIATRKASFGYLVFDTDLQKMDPAFTPVIRNAVSMLAIVLSNLRQTAIVEEMNAKLEDQVARRRRELADSRLQFQQIVEHVEGILWLSTPDWNEMIYVCTGYEKTWGRSCESLYENPRSWLDAIEPDDLSTVLRTIESARTDGQWPIVFPDYRIRRGDGELRWIAAKVFPVYDEHGQVVRAVTYVDDVTDRKRMEQRSREMESHLRQAQKMEALGQLAGGVAHDFNNMLTAILGHTEALLLRLQQPSEVDTEEIIASLEQVQRAGEQSAALTRQLLTFSRKQVDTAENAKPNKVIRDTEALLKRVISDDIEVKVRLSQDVGLVPVDKVQFEQIIMNLILNARDAMPDGGTLSIETDPLDEASPELTEVGRLKKTPYIRITVRDTGIGMDEATSSRVFEPFFTTKAKDKGTGLGLATVYGIIQQAGGEIIVDSELGRGTVFTVYLPCVGKGSVDKPKAVEQELKEGQHTILVCEDEDMVRTLTCNALRNAGYHVLDAEGGEAACALAEQHDGEIALLVTDLVMPDMNGRDVAACLKDNCPNIRIVFMSGYASEMLDELPLDREDVAYLQKPFKLNELYDCVHKVLNTTGHAKS